MSDRLTFRSIVILLSWIIAILPNPIAHSQAARGTIGGRVRDPSGAVVSNGQIRLGEILTNREYVAKTNKSGFYTIVNLMPGSYRLVVEAEGFKRFTQEGIRLTTGEKMRVDATLAVGSPSDTVTVTADVPLLRSETGSLGQLVDNREITDLPLNGRNFVSLVGLSSGVALPPGTAFPRINGGRPRTNEYLYDGISVLQLRSVVSSSLARRRIPTRGSARMSPRLLIRSRGRKTAIC